MPKEFGRTTAGKIEAWLRKNKRSNYNVTLKETLFTVNELSSILSLPKQNIRKALIFLETNNQIRKYGRLKEGIVWENTLLKD